MTAKEVDNARKAAILEKVKAELAQAFLNEYCFVTDWPESYSLSSDGQALYKEYIDLLFEHMMDYSVL